MNRRPLEIITERDVDILLVEELNVSHEFLEWWITAVGEPNPPPFSLIGAFHSASHPTLGESDILLIYRDQSDARHAILIEDKIDAPAQPEQGDRYRQRGKAGVADGEWRTFRTCICAPRRYLDSSADVANYDSQISYEDIRDWLRGPTRDGRCLYRAQIIDSAIEVNKRGYAKKVDDRVTAFTRAYWECVRREFPELEMRDPGPRAAGSGWIELHPSRLPRGRAIFHKLPEGFVDLSITAAADRVAQFTSVFHHLGKDLEVVATGKSASVRLPVPPLDRFRSFDDQIDAARAGMRAAYRLLFLSPVLPAA